MLSYHKNLWLDSKQAKPQQIPCLIGASASRCFHATKCVSLHSGLPKATANASFEPQFNLGVPSCHKAVCLDNGQAKPMTNAFFELPLYRRMFACHKNLRFCMRRTKLLQKPLQSRSSIRECSLTWFCRGCQTWSKRIYFRCNRCMRRDELCVPIVSLNRRLTKTPFDKYIMYS